MQPAVLPTLSVSIVVFRPHLDVVRRTLASLHDALTQAFASMVLAEARIDVIDNGTFDEGELDALVRSEIAPGDRVALRILRGHGNVGYGRGHNLSLLAAESTYHLVLNPDVLMAPDALRAAIEFLGSEPGVGLVAPDVRDARGARQFLCRRFPTIFVLYLRSFAPGFLRRRFAAHDGRYEMRDVIGDSVFRGHFLTSGCFMFGRTAILQRIGGFDPGYFMYFEDYDLSLSLGRYAESAYVPAVRIVHYGGDASGKGLRHVLMYLRSAFTFYSRHGWRLWRA